MFKIQEFFDKPTSTLTYILYDEQTRDAVIIDPVLDFDPADGRIWDASVKMYLEYIRKNKLNLLQVLETHVHADHLSGSAVLKKHLPQVKVLINRRITEVQNTFQKVFQLPNFMDDGSQFDQLLADGEEWQAGSLKFKAIYLPGHTPACTGFLTDGAIFTGDAIFMPDSGTGRCDFPGGSAQTLFTSIKEKLYALPDSTKLFVGHDYQPNGRALLFQTTIGEQKKSNIHIKTDTALETFVEFRETRDKTLAAPRLLLPSLQVNMRAGHWQSPGETGPAYLKIPLKVDVN